MDEQERIKELIKIIKSNPRKGKRVTSRSKRAALRELLNYKDNPQAVNAIVYALGDESSAVRSLAESIAIRELGEEVSDQIIALLEHEDSKVRTNVIFSESLQKICGIKAVEPLIKVLKYDKDANVRGASAWILGDIGDKRALDPLITALDDTSAKVRWSAAKALGQIGDAKAIPKLTDRLMDEHSGVRARSAEALGQIGDDSSLKSLRLALLKILNQMVVYPEKLLEYQEEKKLKEQRIMRIKRRRYYRELDKRIRRSVGVELT